MNILRVTLFALVSLLMPITSYASTCDVEYKRPWYKTRSAFCQAGQLIEDCYRKGSFHPCEDMEVDHTISMFFAFQQGVCGEELKKLANDPDNLCLTYWKTNRSKGAKSPREFAVELDAIDRSRMMERVKRLEQKFGLEPLQSQSKDYRFALAAKELEFMRRENNALRLEVNATKIDPAIFRTISRMKERMARVFLINAGEVGTDIVPIKNMPNLAGSALAVSGFALLAAEISNTCKLNEDLLRLEKQISQQLRPDNLPPFNYSSKICGMTPGELFFSLVGSEIGSKTCAELREKNPLGEFELCKDTNFQIGPLETEETDFDSVLFKD